MSAAGCFARVVDTALEVTIVGSFTSIGYRARAALEGWDDSLARLDGSAAVVTGASSGLGAAIATDLADRGAAVTGVARRTPADTRITAAPCDLGDLADVRRLATRLVASTPTIDVVVHCAGLLSPTFSQTDDGIEVTLAVHLVGPYLLTRLIEPHLADDARVLWMSSGGMYAQGLHLNDLEMDPDRYRGATAYARAKRAQVTLAGGLAETWPPGRMSAAVHPGWADTPGVVSALPRFHRLLGPILRTPRQGIDTMCWLVADAPDEPDGAFWFDRRPRRTVYVPGTGGGATGAELIDWLDARIAQVDPDLLAPLE